MNIVFADRKEGMKINRALDHYKKIRKDDHWTFLPKLLKLDPIFRKKKVDFFDLCQEVGIKKFVRYALFWLNI